MKLKIAIFLAIFALLVNLVAPITQVSAQSSHPTVKLPKEAETQDVVYLGEKIHPKTGKKVKGYAFIHRISSPALSQSTSTATITSTSACYGFYGDGIKWRTPEPWVFNGQNTQGLDPNLLFGIHNKDLNKWEDAADGKVGNHKFMDIVGNGSITADTLSSDITSPDGVNEVYFASIDTPGIVAVTTGWVIADGPVDQRAMVEFDQVFDDVHYAWSTNGDKTKLDFEDISTHELGHAVGMVDLYNYVCRDQTMYGYVAYGETKKRTLASGDIAGINLLY